MKKLTLLFAVFTTFLLAGCMSRNTKDSPQVMNTWSNEQVMIQTWISEKIVWISIAIIITIIFIFTRKKEEKIEWQKFESVLSDINSLRKVSIHLIKQDKQSFTKLWWIPDVYDNFVRPTRNNEPLSFLWQFKFSEINKWILTDYPQNGLLYVFYDKEQSTRWFDPKDKESWKIIYIEDENIKLQKANLPKALELEYNEVFISAKKIYTLPSRENENIKRFQFEGNEFDKYIEYQENFFENMPKHIIWWYPDPVQWDTMQLESEFINNGIYLWSERPKKDEKFKIMEKDSKEWILLLQIDTDDNANMMWWDAWMLYFWIKKEDLKNKKFDNVWMILQCG